MTENAHPFPIHLLEVFEHGPGQLRRDVAVHVIPLVPGRFGRVEIEARAGAEIVRVVFALDLQTACCGWWDESENVYLFFCLFSFKSDR